jgi:DNA-binding transcriptional LysR family regulator
VTYQSGELDDLGIFVAVVDAGGFSAAARVTGARKAHVSRRIQELERRLGVRLLERTTRTVRLTEAGAAYYDRASRAVALAREARAAVDAGRHEPVGLLRITTTQLLAELVLRPVVLAYLGKYPQVSVELDVTSRFVDIVREGFDLALRVGVPSDSNLVGRVIGKGRAICIASPTYLAGVVAPRAPKDLERLDAVTISGGPSEWAFQRRGRKVVVRPRLRLTTPSYALAREAIVAGLGVGRLPSYFVAEDLAGGRLEVVLEPWTPPAISVTAVYASRGLVAPKTRAFVDALTAYVAKRPLPTME